jgi:hypothetical protein
MIIEMTYTEWQAIHRMLGELPVEDLTDKDVDTAIRLRGRIRDYSFDN